MLRYLLTCLFLLVCALPLGQTEQSSSSSSSYAAAGDSSTSSCNAQMATLSSSNQKLETKIENLAKLNEQILKELATIRKEKQPQSLDGLLKEVSELRKVLDSNKKDLENIMKTVESQQQNAILPFIYEKLEKGFHITRDWIGSVGGSSMGMFLDGAFYRAWYDIFIERVEFIKYAVPNKVIPAMKADFAKLTEFFHTQTSGAADTVYKHDLYKQAKEQVTDQLLKLNVDKSQHETVMHGITIVGLLIALGLLYCLLSCFCGCLCPRITTTSSSPSSTSVSASLTASQSSKNNANLRKGKKKKSASVTSAPSSSSKDPSAPRDPTVAKDQSTE